MHFSPAIIMLAFGAFVDSQEGGDDLSSVLASLNSVASTATTPIIFGQNQTLSVNQSAETNTASPNLVVEASSTTATSTQVESVVSVDGGSTPTTSAQSNSAIFTVPALAFGVYTSPLVSLGSVFLAGTVL
jgi:hypothetical protein